MIVLADLEVERPHGDESKFIIVTVRGEFEKYGSYNPHERGWGLESWHVVAPPGFFLTNDEAPIAEEKLYKAAGI